MARKPNYGGTAGTTMVVTLNEDIVINNMQYGSVQRCSVKNIRNVSRRIIAVPTATNGAQVYAGAAAASIGTHVSTGVKYIRITNLDNTNYVTLRITGDASTDYSVRLDAGASHLIISTSSTGVVDYADITGVTLEDLSAISATANTAACDLEIVVASA